MTKRLPMNPTNVMPDLLEEPALRDYLASVRNWHGYIRFLGLPDRRDNPDIIIDRLFIDPLLTRRHVSPDEDPDDWQARAETVVEVLRVEKPLVVLGDPGTGKSTLASYLVSLLAQPGRNALVGSIGWRLPVPMVLREMQIRGVTDFRGLMDAFLEHGMSKPLRDTAYLARALARGQAFILLDGIDEIGDSKARADLRRAVFDGFDRYPSCRWMLTSRIVGYSDAPFEPEIPDEPLDGIAETKTYRHDTKIVTRFIAPFDDLRIQAFAHRWYAQRVAGKTRAAAQAQDLVRAIHEDQAILRLARVPNLLTMMALIHRIEATLPHGRALLYDRISEAYLESIDKYRGIHSGAVDLPHKKLWLSRVGYELQKRRTHSRRHNESELLASTTDVIGWLEDAMKHSGPASSVHSAAEFLDFVRRRSGLLLPRGDDQYAFIHLSFQEYFAAVALDREVTGIDWALNQPTKLCITNETVSSWSRRTSWRETFVFLFEMLSPKKDWHYELQRRIFGDHFASFESENKPPGLSNLAVLLARLLANPQSGFHESHDLAAIRACIRAALNLPSTDLTVDPSSGILAVLFGRDQSRNSFVMDILIGEAISLESKNIRLGGAQISDFAPLRRVGTLERLDLANTRLSDVTPISGIRSLRRLDLMNTRVSDITPALYSHITQMARPNEHRNIGHNSTFLARINGVVRPIRDSYFILNSIA